MDGIANYIEMIINVYNTWYIQNLKHQGTNNPVSLKKKKHDKEQTEFSNEEILIDSRHLKKSNIFIHLKCRSKMFYNLILPQWLSSKIQMTTNVCMNMRKGEGLHNISSNV